MFSIGAFAGLTQVSVRALRLYDRMGLLVPARVDERTGYRYYEARQLDRLLRIRALRDLEVPLATVKDLVDAGATADVLREQLLRRRQAIEAQREHTDRLLASVEARLALLERTRMSDHPVTRKIAPALTVAAVHHVLGDADLDTVDWTGTFGSLFERLTEALDRASVVPTGPALSLYEHADHGGSVVTAALPVAAGVTPPEGVALVDLPPAEVAFTVHNGSMAGIRAAYAAVMGWTEAHGLAVTGASRDVALLWDPAEPDRCVTEIQLVLAADGPS